MKKTLIVTTMILFAAFLSNGYAIDRHARMIDTISVDTADYKDLDYVGGSLWVENMLAAPNEKWALVAGIGIGQYNPDPGGKVTAFELGMGLKYYLLPVTAVSLVGSYQNDDSDDFEVSAGTASLKQRLSSPNAYVSPWLLGSVSLQSADLNGGFLGNNDESFTAVVTTIGGGCDFMMNDDFAFVFSGGFSESEEVDSGEQYADGFFVSIGMQYYWK